MANPITLVFFVLVNLLTFKAIPNRPEPAPTFSPETAPAYSPETAPSYSPAVPSPSPVGKCHPIPEEVEFGCAANVEAHYYLHDPRIRPICCLAIFQDEECVAPRLSGLQNTPFGQDLKNYCSTLHL